MFGISICGCNSSMSGNVSSDQLSPVDDRIMYEGMKEMMVLWKDATNENLSTEKRDFAKSEIWAVLVSMANWYQLGGGADVIDKVLSNNDRVSGKGAGTKGAP
jgi:hypothetical protein